MPVRRILVLGAAGGTGRHVVAQATAMGLEVTALVRSPAPRPIAGSSVRVAIGDVCSDSSVVRGAFSEQDAVISTLGVGQSLASGGLIARAVPLVVSAMREHRVRRLVFMSAFGAGPTWDDTPLLPRLFVRTTLRDIYADKAAGEEIIRSSGLDWTIVCPVALTNGPRTGATRVGERLRLRGFPRISREDVAAVLLQQVNDPKFAGKTILVARR